jgi:lysophospholipase L1-like esterase
MLATTADAQLGPWVPAEHPSLRWEGRVRFNADKAAVFDWASVRVHAGFEGATVAVYADLGQNYLDLWVDGQRMAVLGREPGVPGTAWQGMGVQPQAVGQAAVYIVGGLAPGSHTLTLSKRTGPNFGPVTLQGLRFDAGAQLLGPPSAKPRRIEFIGDSLTNGYGVEGPGLECKSLPPYENSSRSWARLTAEALGAEAQLLAFSGYGLVRNYGAPGASSEDPVPHYYPRSVLAEPEAWDRGRFVPDLAVVFLGTNDFSTQPVPSNRAFEDAYAAFLDEVRKDRPQLKVLLAHPDDKSALAARVQAVVSNQQTVGHWVEALALPNAAQADLGCDWHPKAVVHERWSGLAVAKIKPMMGW